MESSRKSKWLTFWFFLPSSLAMAYFAFYLTSHASTAAEGVDPANGTPYRIQAAIDGKLVLHKGQTRTVGKMKLTYQGLKDDRILLDVTLLDLDPGYAYRRDIPVRLAENGFWLAEQYFRMVSAGRSVLQISRVQS